VRGDFFLLALNNPIPMAGDTTEPSLVNMLKGRLFTKDVALFVAGGATTIVVSSILAFWRDGRRQRERNRKTSRRLRNLEHPSPAPQTNVVALHPRMGGYGYQPLVYGPGGPPVTATPL
jgi:hypothetical protein